ncbi:hypothetical protein BD626DRAFT_202590 [Schizophyllum amplum]|uniref:Uncharacterized protein n=1 Tax=Schizophyllum amplum TaxID=97359 RepID=A0A550CNP2_9AGAR|nr:hypothetical protein BD626DRAFT_202590 [Auriculariopsis ampla]
MSIVAMASHWHCTDLAQVIVVMLFTLPRLGATSSIVVIAKETCLPRASICLEQYDTSIIITYESTVAVSMVGCAWQKAWMNP